MLYMHSHVSRKSVVTWKYIFILKSTFLNEYLSLEASIVITFAEVMCLPLICLTVCGYNLFLLSAHCDHVCSRLSVRGPTVHAQQTSRSFLPTPTPCSAELRDPSNFVFHPHASQLFLLLICFDFPSALLPVEGRAVSLEWAAAEQHHTYQSEAQKHPGQEK